MKPHQIVRIAGIAAVAWVACIASGLVYGSSGPAPDPTRLLLELTAGPILLLALGNGLAWLAGRGSRRDPGAEKRTDAPESLTHAVEHAHPA